MKLQYDVPVKMMNILHFLLMKPFMCDISNRNKCAGVTLHSMHGVFMVLHAQSVITIIISVTAVIIVIFITRHYLPHRDRCFPFTVVGIAFQIAVALVAVSSVSIFFISLAFIFEDEAEVRDQRHPDSRCSERGNLLHE